MRKYYFTALKHILINETKGIYIADYLIWVLVSAIITLLGWLFFSKKFHLTYSKMLMFFMTLVYAGVIMFLTILRRKPGSYPGVIYTKIDFGVGLNGIYNLINLVCCFLNIALFVPWGAILYLYRRNDNKSKAIIMTTLLGFSCSAFVEVTQRITGTGFFELTDIFTNTVGAFIGAAISAGLYTGYRGLKNKNEEQ